MIESIKSVWGNVYLRFILLALAAYLLYQTLVIARPVWISILVAFLLAYLLDPFVTWVARRSSRAFGLLVIATIGLMATASLWFLGARLAAQVSDFVTRIPSLVDQLIEIPYLVARFIDPRFGNLFDQAYINLSRLAELFVRRVLIRAQTLSLEGTDLTGRLLALGGGGAQVAIIIIMTIYLLYNFAGYSKTTLSIVPNRYRPFVSKLFSQAGKSVADYVRAQLLISLVVGALMYLGFMLIGVPLASALGILATIANLIPFLGPVIIALPALLLAATEGGTTVIWTLALIVGVNQLDGHIISPMIFSQVNELDPLLVIIAILAGAAFFGLLGAIIAVPFAAFLKVLYSEYYLKSDWYKHS